jgi:hypothetical protein
MADTKLTALPNAVTLTGSEFAYLSQSAKSVKVTLNTLKAFVGSGSSGASIGSPVSGGTSGSVLFVDSSGNLAQNNTGFRWTASQFILNRGNYGLIVTDGSNVVVGRNAGDTSDSYMQFNGVAGTILNSATFTVSDPVSGNQTLYLSNGYSTFGNATASLASTGTQLQATAANGIIYQGDYSSSIIGNDRAIPDMGTVKQIRRLQKVDIFYSSGTWTKPLSFDGLEPSQVWGFLLGGGGGGGSGRSGATATVRAGGGSGASGVITQFRIQGSQLGTTETVTVGVGGAGGASVSSANGNNGTAGGTSLFSIFIARGGGAGGGGSTGSGTAGTAATSANSMMQIASLVGIASNSGGAAGTVGTSNTFSGPASGGSGGGVNTSNVAAVGGAGGASNSYILTSGAGGGTAGAINGNGGNAVVVLSPFMGMQIGSGGGGGGGSVAGVGGNGGNGAYGSGGGGGGGSTLTAASGAGGNGGDGWIIIVSEW